MRTINFNKGISIGRKQLVRIIAETQPNKSGRPFLFQFIIGQGAGYIGGRTMYIGRNTASALWYRKYRGGYSHRTTAGFEAGVTSNGHRIPWLSH